MKKWSNVATATARMLGSIYLVLVLKRYQLVIGIVVHPVKNQKGIFIVAANPKEILRWFNVT